MSGGVDSSAAAFLMMEKGYDCIGATMRLFGDDETAVRDAAEVCSQLGIAHYALDFKEEFKNAVIRSFIGGYESGITPNPCVECNRHIKFGRLFDSAKELSAACVATGHYARTCYDEASGRHLLKTGLDSNKDQSYVLYSLTQEKLAGAAFPLGELTKPEVRRIAEKNGFVSSDKSESQDICFIPDGDYVGFICGYTGKNYPEGDFVLKDGVRLGAHKGLIRYTQGQRKGLGVFYHKPLYVLDKDITSNRVILGDNSDLFSNVIKASDINLIACERLNSPIRAKVKIRYKHEPGWARVEQTSENNLVIEFDSPQRAATPGQAAVIYDGDVVIGGGTIFA